MEKKRIICEIKISQILGTDEHEHDIVFNTDRKVTEQDYQTAIQMLRGVADKLEEEYTPIRRINPDV